ncbi:MAG: hypothetical protein ACOX60_05640 [Massiliimalia sp.]|jgi:hypothetical protein
MPSKFQKMLKIMAVISSYLFLYPIAALLCVFLDGYHGKNSIFYWLIFVLVGGVSYGIGYLLQYLEQQNKCSAYVKNGLYLGMAIAAFLGGFCHYGSGNVLKRILMGIFVAFSTEWSLYAVSREYKEFADGKPILLGSGINVAVLLFLWVYRRTWGGSFESSYFAYFYLAMILCYVVIRNQANLDYMLERRRHKLEHLPQKVRWYNMVLVLVVFIVVVLGFCFRGELAKGLRWLGGLVLGGIRGIIQFIQWLGSLFPDSEGESMASGEVDFSGLTEGETRSGLPAEFYLFLMLIAVLVVIIWKRRQIGAFLRRLFLRVMELVRSWMGRTGISRQRSGESEYYRDWEQELSQEEIQATAHDRDQDSWKRWKRSYRRYCRMELIPQRFRTGYHLLVRWINLQGGQVLPSDTTLEILQKEQNLTKNTNCTQITEKYNLFRYREDDLSSEDYRQMDELLENCLKQERTGRQR